MASWGQGAGDQAAAAAERNVAGSESGPESRCWEPSRQEVLERSLGPKYQETPGMARVTVSYEGTLKG